MYRDDMQHGYPQDQASCKGNKTSFSPSSPYQKMLDSVQYKNAWVGDAASPQPDKLHGEVICNALDARSAILLNLIGIIEGKLFGPSPASTSGNPVRCGIVGLIEDAGDRLLAANSALESIIAQLGGR